MRPLAMCLSNQLAGWRRSTSRGLSCARLEGKAEAMPGQPDRFNPESPKNAQHRSHARHLEAA
jgi:hypothetical protein